MANQRTKSAAKKTASRRRSSKYVCPQCGFKAAHPAGLGRHRSAIHGTISKRQRARRTSSGRGRVSGGRVSQDGQLAKRVSDLERRYDRLLGGLEQLLKRAKRV